MAKNQNSEPKPKVSKLPLPATDSPLVIDLPDGQKIVIGKMTNGSVIEVATWRGVGRPDSRTSRLMLGVGNGNVEEESSELGSAQNEMQTPKPTGFAQIPFFARKAMLLLQRNLVAEVPKLIAKISSTTKNRPARFKSVSNSDSPKVEIAKKDAAVDQEVQEWLNRITQSAAERNRKSSPKSNESATRTPKNNSKSPKSKSKSK